MGLLIWLFVLAGCLQVGTWLMDYGIPKGFVGLGVGIMMAATALYVFKAEQLKRESR